LRQGPSLMESLELAKTVQPRSATPAGRPCPCRQSVTVQAGRQAVVSGVGNCRVVAGERAGRGTICKAALGEAAASPAL
jgi:hypothetical protein